MYLRQKSLRKLDVIVAEKVMGHKIIPNNGKDRPEEWAKEKYFIEVDFGISLIPPYSTDIAAAWEVVEKFEYIDVRRFKDHWGCTVYGQTVTGKTAPEAICKASLLAVMDGEDKHGD